MSTEVFLTRSAAYLPLDPVSNDEIEQVLGMVGGKPSRARRMVLRSNGIQQRHYAIDRATGEPVMSNAELAAAAIRALGPLAEVDCLAMATSMPDQIMPNHGVMVHGELGWPRLEVVSSAGVCLAGVAALKHAWLSVRAGESARAVACASELPSPILRAQHFEPEHEHKLQALETRPEIAFEKDFLRWMLSDGAGAFLLESRPAATGLSLRIDWIEMSSAANELPACMYLGADRADDAQDSRLAGWARFTPQEWATRSVFAVKQDVRLLNEHIVRATLRDPLEQVIAKRGLRAQDIDWFLPHMSSFYFEQPIAAALRELGLEIPRERWFTNLATRGNTGAASIYIMVDELLRSGQLKRGQRLLAFVPESGRFSSGFFHMEVV
ncbi:MAG: beta-ketoacyl-ACP synthase III [Moraxellaceae bacterium]|nr:beta-ketoacyl-ACP synthase III [Moraxellaceae bacterium]